MGRMSSSANVRAMNWSIEDREYVRKQQLAQARKATADLQEIADARRVQLSNLLPGEKEWEAFWATVAEDATPAQVIAAIENKLAEIQGPHREGEEVGL